MKELITGVMKWADGKGIYDKSTADKQMLLMIKELGETAEAIMLEDYKAAKMELGDVIVCYINWVKMSGKQVFLQGFEGDYSFDPEISDLEVLEGIMGAMYARSMIESAIAALASRLGTTAEECLRMALARS